MIGKAGRGKLPVNVDVSGLAYPMAAVLCLSVHGGVPVTIVEYHSVSSRQVHTHSSRPRRQDEAEDSLVSVEPLHQHLSDMDTTFRPTGCLPDFSRPRFRQCQVLRVYIFGFSESRSSGKLEVLRGFSSV